MKLKLQKPALIAAVSYLVLIFLALLPTKIVKKDGQTFEPTFINRLLTVPMMLIPFGLSVYSIQCQITGGCFTWSYLQATMIAIWVILFVAATFLASENAKEQYRNQIR